jgi:hypothetical protein
MTMAPAGREVSLPFQERLPHLGDRGERRDETIDLRPADVLGHIRPVDEDAREPPVLVRGEFDVITSVTSPATSAGRRSIDRARAR